MSAPDPTLDDLADRLAARGRWVVTKRVPLFPQMDEEEWVPDADCAAAAVRLREQDVAIENLKAANALAVGHLVNVDDLPELTRPPHPHSASLLAQRERDDARLRKLDRIEAALGDVPDWIDSLEANIGNHCTIMSVSAQADLVTLFRRLADALEDTDGA